MDNSSSHRGQKAAKRLKAQWPNVVLINTPVHASWLNQIEIYFAIVQRKALTPNDFYSLEHVRERLLGFQKHYQQIARPFRWTFSRKNLNALMARLGDKSLAMAA